MKKQKSISDILTSMGACCEAVEWSRQFKSRQKAWDACERGDHLLWILGRTVTNGSQQHRAVVLAACKCARLSLKHVTKGETRPLAAIQTAEWWCRGKASIEDVRTAAYAASYAAYVAADSAYAASYAANAAADAASYAAYAARIKMLKRCVEIVRKSFPKPPTIEG